MKDLGGALSYFANQYNKSSFDDPFDKSPESGISSTQIKSIIDEVDDRRDEEKKKKKKKDKFSKVMEKGADLIDRFASDEYISQFDDFISNYIVDDEDVSLKNSLLSLGRKYARDTKISGEASEITKAYSGNEKILTDLLGEIDKDKNELQNDITKMRLVRTKNPKVLVDMIAAKAQFHNMALNVVKELNSMKKTQMDLQLKTDKNKQDSENGDIASNKAIQNLFSLGRGNIIGAVGGYSSVSGALDEDDVIYNDTYSPDEDEVIQKKFFSSDDYEESDGDKFLKYEGRGVEYVLLIDEDGHKDIIAEDSEGNIIPDYPMPTDINSLTFNISEMTGTATDDYNRQYKVRRI